MILRFSAFAGVCLLCLGSFAGGYRAHRLIGAAKPAVTTAPKHNVSAQPAPFIRFAYKVTEIAGPGGHTTIANAINERGDVTGGVMQPSGFMHVYLYRKGRMRDLGALSSRHSSVGTLLNDHDQIAGGTSNDLAFFWDGANMRQIHVLNYPDYEISMRLSGLNDKGIIIGSADLSTYDIGYIWWRGHVRLLPHRQGQETRGLTIDNHGDYLWWQATPRNQGTGTYMLREGRRQTNIVLPKEIVADPIDLQVAANERHDFVISPFDTRPIIVRHGRVLKLAGIPGFGTVEANAINNRDEIVGECWKNATSPSRAFLYHSGTDYDLNSLIDPKSGWVLTAATGINDPGQIVGNGLHHGRKRGFILTPMSGWR